MTRRPHAYSPTDEGIPQEDILREFGFGVNDGHTKMTICDPE
jgi:hypothetical protein